MKEIRFYGRGGQGAFTASKILGAAAVLDGKYALAFPSFGPERRGAPVNAYTKIADGPVVDRSQPQKFDAILVLDDTLFDHSFLDLLKDRGKIYINTSKQYDNEHLVSIDATQAANEILHKNIVNTAILAYFIESTNIVSQESFQLVLQDFLPKGIITANLELVKRMGGLVYETSQVD
ncbi:pyruvate:ferredoxin oxidoreductase, gamma subunit [Lachnospiraceae bacterium KM106-2]|nr:pyruvate:ferredoxin oxidoreductase, gamma subunit [Lachnospiraceae bacterium KM106-2]